MFHDYTFFTVYNCSSCDTVGYDASRFRYFSVINEFGYKMLHNCLNMLHIFCEGVTWQILQQFDCRIINYITYKMCTTVEESTLSRTPSSASEGSSASQSSDSLSFTQSTFTSTTSSLAGKVCMLWTAFGQFVTRCGLLLEMWLLTHSPRSRRSSVVRCHHLVPLTSFGLIVMLITRLGVASERISHC